ncbi:MAG TPA: hypothetical protein VFG87_29575 [Amycolatopsis sp.]|jgi:hypothetical protein|nr:hypothetical protein [Amycolatopsis sp.]
MGVVDRLDNVEPPKDKHPCCSSRDTLDVLDTLFVDATNPDVHSRRIVGRPIAEAKRDRRLCHRFPRAGCDRRWRRRAFPCRASTTRTAAILMTDIDAR